MTKKHFIALADAVVEHNRIKRNVFGANAERQCFNVEQLEALADFCAEQSPLFKRDRWLGYIAGTNGKNGGPVWEKTPEPEEPRQVMEAEADYSTGYDDVQSLG